MFEIGKFSRILYIPTMQAIKNTNGNSCYAIAAMQFLSSSLFLRNEVYNHKDQHHDTIEGCMHCVVVDMILSMMQEQRECYDISELYPVMEAIGFSSKDRHDSMEFFNAVVNHLFPSLRNHITIQYDRSVTCTTCHLVIDLPGRTEISLALSGSMNDIQEAIDMYLVGEQPENYHCNFCTTDGNTIENSIKDYPRELIIHNVNGKAINVPEFLTFGICTYRLMSFVQIHGQSDKTRHYTCTKLVIDKWIKFDDERKYFAKIPNRKTKVYYLMYSRMLSTVLQTISLESLHQSATPETLSKDSPTPSTSNIWESHPVEGLKSMTLKKPKNVAKKSTQAFVRHERKCERQEGLTAMVKEYEDTKTPKTVQSSEREAVQGKATKSSSEDEIEIVAEIPADVIAGESKDEASSEEEENVPVNTPNFVIEEVHDKDTISFNVSMEEVESQPFDKEAYFTYLQLEAIVQKQQVHSKLQRTEQEDSTSIGVVCEQDIVPTEMSPADTTEVNVDLNVQELPKVSVQSEKESMSQTLENQEGKKSDSVQLLCTDENQSVRSDSNNNDVITSEIDQEKEDNSSNQTPIKVTTPTSEKEYSGSEMDKGVESQSITDSINSSEINKMLSDEDVSSNTHSIKLNIPKSLKNMDDTILVAVNEDRILQPNVNVNKSEVTEYLHAYERKKKEKEECEKKEILPSEGLSSSTDSSIDTSKKRKKKLKKNKPKRRRIIEPNSSSDEESEFEASTDSSHNSKESSDSNSDTSSENVSLARKRMIKTINTQERKKSRSSKRRKKYEKRNWNKTGLDEGELHKSFLKERSSNILPQGQAEIGHCILCNTDLYNNIAARTIRHYYSIHYNRTVKVRGKTLLLCKCNDVQTRSGHINRNAHHHCPECWRPCEKGLDIIKHTVSEHKYHENECVIQKRDKKKHT